MARAFSQVLLEAIIIGIVLVVLGYIVGWLTWPLVGVNLPKECNAWNDKYMYEVNLFLIGFLFWIGMEYGGGMAHVCNKIMISSQ